MRNRLWSLAVAIVFSAPVFAGEYDLVIEDTTINVTGKERPAMAINGSTPGPLLKWREGEQVTINVTNRLSETASIHWHGLILPQPMDGVPGVTFDGIPAGETFTYSFQVKQSGTYWYHSHSGLQEQLGVYGPIVIEPAEGEHHRVDRDYTVMLSDWTDENPYRVLAKLKKHPDYYNFRQRTVMDFFRDVADQGWSSAWRNRTDWGAMRMNPTDIADITGHTYSYLVNGRSPGQNWTGLFSAGEKVRLRFINSAAMTFFDVRIPGLKLTVVAADGQPVEPVVVDEFRIAVAETYDVIVEPEADQAYTVFAEAMDRSGYARGTLAPRPGMSAAVPDRRQPPLLTMRDMGMDHFAMMGHDGGGDSAHAEHAMPMDAAMRSGNRPTPSAHRMEGHSMHPAPAVDTGPMTAMPSPPMNSGMHADHAADHAAGGQMARPSAAGAAPWRHGPDHHGPANEMVAEMATSRLHEPGNGLEDSSRRVLVYTDLRRWKADPEAVAPEREIELHLTGSMERYVWSFDGKTYAEDSIPIAFRHNERVRITLVNDTMMNHPIHLHGMWSDLDVGAGTRNPRKHTINVKPGERLSFDVTADALGEWAFHCHLMYHMATGMFRTVKVSDSEGGI